jgi:branched-chain amino acid transport system permease protein
MSIAASLYTRLSRHRKLLAVGSLLLISVFLATYPLYSGAAYYTRVLATILMYAVLAMSWAMFSGTTGYMSLATAAFFGVGVMAMALLEGTLPFPVIIVIGSLLASALAFLIGLVTLRLRGIYFAIFSFGFVMFIGQIADYIDSHILDNVWGHEIPLMDVEVLYYLILGLFVVTLVAIYFIRRSRYGLALLSIGGNEEAAAHMGINTTMVKVILFTISAVFAGAAGAIWANSMVHVESSIAFNVFNSFMPILMAIFGGMGHFYGPVVGAVVFGYLDQTLKIQFQTQFMLVFGIILVMVILFLPNGIVGLVTMVRDKLGGAIAKSLKGGQAEQHANT